MCCLKILRSDSTQTLLMPENSEPSSHMNGRKCDLKKLGGCVSIGFCLAIIVLAGCLASGIFGGGSMYMLSGGLSMISIAPALIATKLLCEEKTDF
jgi:hypothetical protein